MEVGMIRRVDIEQEMQQSYLDYAMSVIVARALPDARDGLKPVQRRILYAMYDLNLGQGSAYKKSARIVGEVLGKYHPHGDVAVYEAMARMAQDFSLRYLLVDGQGNFGSVDGDPPAAMRYTEARLQPFATDLMTEIERDTVDFIDNFDGTLREPVVMPATIPNLLVNGASGIAVGMATSIPPHNLGEVVDALGYMLEQWDHLDDVVVSDLMRFIKGPDFPTGGIILQESGENALEAAYGSGRGRVIVRGRVHAEDLGRGRIRLIITELPYQTNKSNLIERIADLVRDGTLEVISDLRDESDRQGMRIVIELKQGTDMDSTLRTLYKSTPLQTTFGISLLALVDGEPRLLHLKQALRVFLEHRLTVVRRRSEYDLAKAKARAHILEGLRVALKHLDEIISLIRGAGDVEQARIRLVKRYDLSETQATAILEMQLRRLASLERKKIEEEYKQLSAAIKDLEALLGSPIRMREVVETELKAIRQTYGDRRRTQIVSLKEGATATQFLTASDLTPNHEVWVGITADGKVSRGHATALPDMTGEAAPRWLIHTSTRHTLYLCSTQGQAAAVAVSTLVEAESFANGTPLYKACSFAPEDRLAFIFAVSPEESSQADHYVLAVTRQGMVKKSNLADLPGASAQKFTIVKVNNGDDLLSVFITDGSNEIGLLTEAGMAIRFTEEDVRAIGLSAAGVMGIKLAEDDAVIFALPWQEDEELLLAANDGAALRIPSTEFALQGRYGQGVTAIKLSEGARVVGVLPGSKNTAMLVHIQGADARRLHLSDVPLSKRAAKPSVLIPLLKGGGRVTGLTSLGLDESLSKGKSKASSKKKPSAAAKKGAAKPEGLQAKSAAGQPQPVQAGPKTKSSAGSSAKPSLAIPLLPEVPVAKPAPPAAPKRSPSRLVQINPPCPGWIDP